MRKTVIFIADSLDNAHKFQQVLSGLDVDVAAGSSVQFKKLLSQHPSYDLVIYEARADALATLSQVESVLLEDGSASLLVIVNEAQLPEFRLPVQVKSDFVVHGAGSEECAARIRQLLWPGNESTSTDYVTVHNMTINLATYQVTVGGSRLTSRISNTRCWRLWSLIRAARTAAMPYCAACGASVTTAAAVPSTCMSGAFAQSSDRSFRSIWKRYAASAIFGAHSRQTVLV